MPEMASQRKHGDVRNRGNLSPKQKSVLKKLEGGKKPPEIAKTMKISVNGVYGHMRRIEAAGVDLSRFRASNGSRKKPTRKRGAPDANSNGHSPGVVRFLKTLDDEESALKDEARDLEETITSANARLGEVGGALQGIDAARSKAAAGR